MILPILRLVLIYLFLVAGVVAVFNRDRLAPLLSGGRDADTAAVSPAPPPETPVPETHTPETPIPEASAPEAPAPAYPMTEPTASKAQGTSQGEATGASASPVFPDPANPAAAGNAAEQPPLPVAPVAPAPTSATPPGAPAPLGTPVATAPPPATAPAGEAEGISDDTAALAEAIGAARAAYWSGDIAGARTRMDSLFAAHPDNAEVAGELGNLAFALRDYPAAAEAWHRAGSLLIDRGEGARVMSFLPFLQSIAPDKAAELSAWLQDR